MTYDGETHKASIHLLSAFESMCVSYYYIPQDSRFKDSILKAKELVKDAVNEMIACAYMRIEVDQ